jgi:hypothetical protein
LSHLGYILWHQKRTSLTIRGYKYIFLRQSDCFYNGGWTEDIREVVNYLHQKYPEAPLFAVGASLGANILVQIVIFSFTAINILIHILFTRLYKLPIQVKYLGEEGENTPVAGAASICSPWDLLVSEPQLADYADFFALLWVLVIVFFFMHDSLIIIPTVLHTVFT